MNAETTKVLDSLPVLFDGEYVGTPRGWTFPEFSGDAAFWVRGYNGQNPRKIARLNGEVFVQWPGFSWQKGDC